MSKERKNFVGECQIVRGCPYPDDACFVPKNIEEAMDYVPKDCDIIIEAYPKTGSTWVYYIVLQIISKGGPYPRSNGVIYKSIAMEVSGTGAVDALTSKPRLYKRQVPYNMVQKNNKTKFICTYRHPEDTVASYYHFVKNIRLVPFNQLDFDQFFDGFVTGNIGYGSYFRHVLSAYEHRDDSNLLMVSYEKLSENTREEILRIARFLGDEYYECLANSEEVLNNVLENTSFEYLKKNVFVKYPNVKLGVQNGEKAEKPKLDFFRKGIVGDGRNLLSDDQRERLKEAARKVLNGTSIIEEWYPNFFTNGH